MFKFFYIHFSLFFFFNDTATTEIYTLSLHDALPISHFKSNCKLCSISSLRIFDVVLRLSLGRMGRRNGIQLSPGRSEEHTSELQSHSDLVCRLLLEKKKKYK